MADKKLSSVSAVSDMNYVYAETSTGETVKISKADLASVVAEQIGFNASTQFKERGLISSGTNMDDLGMGIWNRYSGSYTINNKPPYDSFIAVVYRSGSYVVQIAYNAANNSQSVRRIYYGGNLTSWQ